MKVSTTLKSPVEIVKTDILSDGWATLKNVHYKLKLPDGQWQSQAREVYDRGDGITVLLYNPTKKTVILTKQFRIPTYLNGNTTGMMIEACAGMLENEDPEAGMVREIEEETGYRIPGVKKIMEPYMSPGPVTELLYYYIAQYEDHMKVHDGGGLMAEQENIEVLELKFSDALDFIQSGHIKDAKTIILLQYAQIHRII